MASRSSSELALSGHLALGCGSRPEVGDGGGHHEDMGVREALASGRGQLGGGLYVDAVD